MGVILPLVMLAAPVVRRSAGGLAAAAGLAVAGVVLNRLNVAITGMLAGSRAEYVPSWMEVQITLAIVAAGLLAYLWIVEHLPVFHGEARLPSAAVAEAGDAVAHPRRIYGLAPSHDAREADAPPLPGAADPDR